MTINLIFCYNNTDLKKTKDTDIASYSRDNGYDGCYALYDQGANSTEVCTQFKLKPPYTCCKVYYEVGTDFKNEFCMPIVNTKKGLKDVKYAFRNADELDIQCGYKFLSFSLFLYIFISIVIF